MKSGHTRAFNVIEFIGELVTSFFMGFIGFFAASYFLESHAAAAGVAGMSAHFSTRLLFQAEGLLTAYATAWANRVKAGK